MSDGRGERPLKISAEERRHAYDSLKKEKVKGKGPHGRYSVGQILREAAEIEYGEKEIGYYWFNKAVDGAAGEEKMRSMLQEMVDKYGANHVYDVIRKDVEEHWDVDMAKFYKNDKQQFLKDMNVDNSFSFKERAGIPHLSKEDLKRLGKEYEFEARKMFPVKKMKVV